MPINSRDVQFGAAIGFIVIVGIVAIYFGFSTKLVLALLAGLGILFCASLVEGYVRAAMLGTGALLLVLIAYDLATSCDSACQQARAEAAKQRGTQEQARLAAYEGRPATSMKCPGLAPTAPHPIGNEWEEINPDGCDFTYTMFKGGVEFTGKDKGPLQPGEVTRYVRATSPDTAIYYMLCPPSTGPRPGTLWECRRVQ
ncbi:MAG: hypothetical protein WB764_23890 [Xanthobacteraceae bacterium]